MSAEEAKQPEPVRVQVLEKLGQLMTAAFGLVAALAWNDAIRAFMAQYLGAGESVAALAAYALTVTVVAVLVAVWIGNSVGRAKKVVARRRAPPATPGAP